MKYTLLEMVQLILSSMGSDEVNDIADNTEAQDIVKIIKFMYFNIVADYQLPEYKTVFELEASGDNTQPTIMTVPTDILEVNNVKYNQILSTETNPDFVTVDWMDWHIFRDMMHSYNTDNTNIGTFDRTIEGDTITFKYVNDKFPQWYSSFDDNTLVFDSYMATEDTTLQKTKTQCDGVRVPTFTESNGFTPDLDHKQFMLLINDAKALAHTEIKQTVHAKAERMARRNLISLQKSKHKTKQPQPDFARLPNYGRK